MQRFAFRLLYIGKYYSGSQKQSNGMAVENFLELAFIKSKYIHSFKENNFINTSRTDAGVSSIYSVFILDMENIPILDKINRFLPKNYSIYLLDYAIVDDEFNPRYAKEKTYSYLVENPSTIICKNFGRINYFIGYHNYQYLIKKDGAGMNEPHSHITDIELVELDGDMLIIFTGDKFGREQIRKIIGYISNEKFIDILPSHILEKEFNSTIDSVIPNNLILIDIKYNIIPAWLNSNEEILSNISRIVASLNIKVLNKIIFYNSIY